MRTGGVRVRFAADGAGHFEAPRVQLLRGREIVGVAGALHLGDEAITSSRDGFDELWRISVISQRRADFAQVQAQYAFANEGRRPDGFAQFLVRNQPAGMLGHIPEQRERLGAQRDHLGPPKRLLVANIELVGRRRAVGLRGHDSRLRPVALINKPIKPETLH